MSRPMRVPTAALAALLLLTGPAGIAAAQDGTKKPDPKPAAPKPAPAKKAPPPKKEAAPKPPPPLQFLGDDTIRRPDGTLVVFYRVNFVDSKVLLDEIKRWLPKDAKAEVSGAAIPKPPVDPTKTREYAPFSTASNRIRIEIAEDKWPELKRVLQMVDAPEPQVLVECKIVEIRHTTALRIGIDASVQRPVGDTFFRKLETQFLSPDPAGFAEALAATEDKFITFDYVLSATKSGANAEVRAMPSVIATQGEVAEIKVADREPIVQQQFTGSTITTRTNFEDVGLNLKVQPLFVGREFVRAQVDAELSRLSGFRTASTSSTINVVNPVISTRSAKTMVTVPDGETLVIAGLAASETNEEHAGIPVLRELPIVGPFFGSTDDTEGKTELVFFITLTILRPGEARLVLPPTDELQDAADEQSPPIE